MVHHNRATALLGLQQSERARVAADAALNLDSNNAEARVGQSRDFARYTTNPRRHAYGNRECLRTP
jgi:hypothetical protein